MTLLRSVLLSLLLLTLAQARPSSHQDEFEVEMAPAGTVLASPVAGDPVEAMKLVWELYRAAGPKIGSRFVEPCYLLCLGDLRPYAAWNGFMLDPQPEDEAVYDRINEILVPRGLSIHPREKDKDGRVAAFSLRSLAGLEKRTRESRLSWVPKYDRATGWPGYYAWKEDCYKGLPDDENAYHLVEGIMLGYPDPAVEQFPRLVWNSWPTTVDATIPDASYYVCGTPIFSLRAEDSSHPAVVATENEWQSFLQRCYSGQEHRRLAADPAFVEQRLRLLLPAEKPLAEGDFRYSEARRLGLSRETAELSLNSEHERWLRAHLAELLRGVESSADTAVLARSGSGTGLDSRHIWSWLLRGSVEKETPAAQLFAAYLDRYPDSYARLYRRELDRRCQGILRKGDSDNPGWDGEALAQMLRSDYARALWPRLPAAEQDAVLRALSLRRGYTPLQNLGAPYPKLP